MDDETRFSLTDEEKDLVLSEKNTTGRVNTLFGFIISKLNSFYVDYMTHKSETLNDIGNNRLMMSDISTSPDEIILINKNWVIIPEDVLAVGTVYMFVCKQGNESSVKLSIVADNISSDKLDVYNKENTLLVKNDLRTNEVYLARVSETEQDVIGKHIRLYSLGDNNEELEVGDIDSLIADLLEDNENEKIVLGMSEEAVDARIKTAIDDFIITNNLKKKG